MFLISVYKDVYIYTLKQPPFWNGYLDGYKLEMFKLIV